MSRKGKRVTLRDVARHAGVSPTAVSFAYNAPHQLSHTTREHILDTAEHLGYQPHPVARTLATGRTNSIGLLVPTSLNWMLHDPLFTHFLGKSGRRATAKRCVFCWRRCTISGGASRGRAATRSPL